MELLFRVFIEFLIVLIIVWMVHYFLVAKKAYKNEKETPLEVKYLNKIYPISLKKEQYQSLAKITSLLNSFIIALVYIFIVYCIKGFIWQIILGIILSLLLIIIFYGLLGRFYEKKGRK